MASQPFPLRKGQEDSGNAGLGADLIRAAYGGNLGLARTALEQGASVAVTDERSGLSALHIAVGTNNLALCRYLIEQWDAPFGPDKFGRWPTVVAIQCRVDVEVGDYIVEKEAEWIAAHPS